MRELCFYNKNTKQITNSIKANKKKSKLKIKVNISSGILTDNLFHFKVGNTLIFLILKSVCIFFPETMTEYTNKSEKNVDNVKKKN